MPGALRGALGTLLASLLSVARCADVSGGEVDAPIRPHGGAYLNLPVRIITLSKGSIPKPLFHAMGFTDVRESTETTADLEHFTAAQLEHKGIITGLARLTLMDGQRRSYELPGVGAVGDFLSHLQTCDPDRDVLVVEEDAIPQSFLTSQLPAALALTKDTPTHDGADIVIFAPISLYQGMDPWVKPDQPAGSVPGFEPLGNRGFFGTQGVLYTARGCRRLRRLLGPPIYMQIDGAISYATQTANMIDVPANHSLNVWVEVGSQSIVQEHSLGELFKEHINGGCCFCYSASTACMGIPMYILTVALGLAGLYLLSWQSWLWGRRSMYETTDGTDLFCWFLCPKPLICPPISPCFRRCCGGCECCLFRDTAQASTTSAAPTESKGLMAT